MTTATIEIPNEDLLNALKLTRKFRGSPFPLTLADIPPSELTAMANAYATIALQRTTTTENLGRQLVRLADAHIAAVVDNANAPGEEVVTHDAATVFTKADGTLLAGRGNPNGALSVVSNGKLELAVGARKHKDPVLPVPTAGAYAIELAEGEDWIVPFSVGLLGGSTNNITEVYDVVFTMFGDSTGQEAGGKAAFDLVWTGEKYLWVGVDGLPVISDSISNDKKSAVQNIQRLSFFSEVVTPAIPAGSVPVGDFKVRLQATHRKTSEVLVNDITVAVTKAE